MSDLLILVAGGAVVGLAIGMTGVGGGSLMTPFLNFLGLPLPAAIGTDLLYATATKAGGVLTHHHLDTIRWNITLRLASGSVPAAILTAMSLKVLFTDREYERILGFSLGLMLVATATMLVFRKKLLELSVREEIAAKPPLFVRHANIATVVTGFLLGVFVTLSSVGAGVLGTAALLLLYPHLKPLEVIGTELAHAIPLTMIAGISHWLLLDNVRWMLLLYLLIGSLPAVYIGTRISTLMSQDILRMVLALVLGLIGLRFILV